MRIAVLAPTRSEAFPVPIVERIGPIVHGLVDRGHQIVVALRPGQAAPAWSRAAGIETVPIRRRLLRGSSPTQSSSAARFAHNLLRGYGEWLTGLDAPEGWPHLAGKTQGATRVRADSLAALIGCDAAVALAPYPSADLVILDGSLPESSDDGGAGLSLAIARVHEIHALSSQVARIASRRCAHSHVAVQTVPWPTDGDAFSPDSPDARAALSLDADAMVCVWIPPSHGLGDPTFALASFATLMSDAREFGGKIHFLLPARSEAEANKLRKLCASVVGAAQAQVSVPIVTDLASWARLLRASNVGIASGGRDYVGLTVMDALASGCPVVTFRNNGAADVLQPGASGESISIAAKPQNAAEAMARLLATERAQRSRSFVAMAGHLPSVDEAVDAWERSLSRAFERRLLAESGLAQVSRRSSDTQLQVAGASRPLQRWIEAGFELHGRGTAEESALLSAANLRLPDAVLDPIDARVIERDEDGFLSSHKIPGAGGRDKIFMSGKPGNLSLKVFRRDPVEGVRVHRLLHQLQDAGFLCAQGIRSGSDGRRSFTIVADAPGLPVIDFLAFANAGGHESGLLSTRLVCAALGRTLADVHAADLTLGGIGVDGLRAVIDPHGEIRIAIAEPWTLRAVVGAGDAPEAIRDLAWLALSVRRLAELRGGASVEVATITSDAIAGNAAAASDVARAIGAAAYGASSRQATQPQRELAPTSGSPAVVVRDPVSRVAMLRVVAEWCARRGRGESLEDVLSRVGAVLPKADAARRKATDQRRSTLEDFARERVRRGELVPARLEEI